METSKDEEFIKNALNKYSDMIIHIAYHNIGNMCDVDDIMQEVYVKLIQSDICFESENHLKAWLIKVTINKCKDYLKSFWYKKNRPLQDISATYYLLPEENEVLSEVCKLPFKYKNILYLYYFEEYSLQEISELLGKSVNTVSSQLQRARQKLKFMMEGEKANERRHISECTYENQSLR